MSPRNVNASVDGVPVIASMTDGISESELAEIRGWRGSIAGHADEGWDWDDIASEHPVDGGHRWLLLTQGGAIRSVAVLEEAVEVRIGASGMATRLAYLASSPRDRSGQQAGSDARAGRLTPAGRLMMLASILHSKEVGNAGRLCWHAEQDAEAWYEELFPGVRSIELDKVGEFYFRYFEITSAQAAAYVAAHGALLVDGVA